MRAGCAARRPGSNLGLLCGQVSRAKLYVGGNARGEQTLLAVVANNIVFANLIFAHGSTATTQGKTAITLIGYVAPLPRRAVTAIPITRATLMPGDSLALSLGRAARLRHAKIGQDASRQPASL